jgi:NAD(P)-dependent dehydrogenase (short-subunit alcohol dehydrogenase family)
MTPEATPARPGGISPAEIQTCLQVLAQARAGGLDDESTLTVQRAVAETFREAKKQRRAAREARRIEHDRGLLAEATRHRVELPDAGPGAAAPPTRAKGGRALLRARRCYVCKEPFREVDVDYHQMCPQCAQWNSARRDARCDLRGRHAIVTGGRIKIGFHTALKLLRDGADVVVTTRFPSDAARRFAAVSDFGDWSDRLHLHGVDLLDLPGIVGFLALVRDRWDHLDILVNNAAQTLHRPAAYHRAIRAAERWPLTGQAARLDMTPAASRRLAGTSGELEASTTVESLFPRDRTDESGQPLDLRLVNSWVLRDGAVSPREWLEVHVVNAFAPFLLTSRLRPLLEASPFADRYVVQVSAMEGSFSRDRKTERHPHTNMAKASLNMLTRTVAGDYQRAGISMTSVDTGWVTDERPHPRKLSGRAEGFRPPLDVIDGAARVYDPIVRGIGGHPMPGQFLKDYQSVGW